MYAGFSFQSYQIIFHLVPRAIANTFGLTAASVSCSTWLSGSWWRISWPGAARGPMPCSTA